MQHNNVTVHRIVGNKRWRDYVMISRRGLLLREGLPKTYRLFGTGKPVFAIIEQVYDNGAVLPSICTASFHQMGDMNFIKILADTGLQNESISAKRQTRQINLMVLAKVVDLDAIDIRQVSKKDLQEEFFD